jgi:hypothetical protein
MNVCAHAREKNEEKDKEKRGREKKGADRRRGSARKCPLAAKRMHSRTQLMLMMVYKSGLLDGWGPERSRCNKD